SFFPTPHCLHIDFPHRKQRGNQEKDFHKKLYSLTPVPMPQRCRGLLITPTGFPSEGIHSQVGQPASQTQAANLPVTKKPTPIRLLAFPRWFSFQSPLKVIQF